MTFPSDYINPSGASLIFAQTRKKSQLDPLKRLIHRKSQRNTTHLVLKFVSLDKKTH